MRTVGVYVTCDDALCEPCFEEDGGLEAWKERGGFESWEEPINIDEDSESDSPTHCQECGRLIEHDLTNEGLDYVGQAILDCFKAGLQSPVVRMWADHYHALGYEILNAGDGWELAMSDATYLLRLLPMDMHPAFERYRKLMGFGE